MGGLVRNVHEVIVMANSFESKGAKSRYWGFEFYPESMPDNWKDIIEATHIPVVVSPLHDKDVNEDAERTPKKPHYHGLMCFGNTTTDTTCKRLAEALGFNGKVVPINSFRGYYRYLWHADNPEKYQYDKNDLQRFNGFNVEDYDSPTKGEVMAIRKKVTGLLRSDLLEGLNVASLLEYLEDEGDMDAWSYVLDHIVAFSKLVESYRFKSRDKAEKRHREAEAAFNEKYIVLPNGELVERHPSPEGAASEE